MVPSGSIAVTRPPTPRCRQSSRSLSFFAAMSVCFIRITESATGKSFFYIPGCAKIDDDLAARIRGASLVFFDGTLWHENEMIEQGLLGKTGTRMGHINMSGPDGSIAALAPLGVARKIYVHINNSNPALNAFSKERQETEAAGWVIGEDGMEIQL